MTATQLADRFPALTRHLPPREFAALESALVARQVEAGRVLISYGSMADTMYFVMEGVLSIFIEESGSKLVLGQATPGSVVGEIGLIDPGEATATVQAVTDCQLRWIDHDTFARFSASNPRAASAVLRALSLDLVKRLRGSSVGLLRRVDEHEWMRLEARRDHEGWVQRLGTLLIGRHHGGVP